MGLLFESFYWDSVALLVGVLTVCYLVLSRNFNHWKNKGVTSLKPNLLLGNCKKLFFFELSPGQFVAEIYNKAKAQGKPYVGFFIFGRPALVIRDLDVVKNVLIKDFNYFAERHSTTHESVDPVGALSLFLLKGPKWKHMRANLTPIFTSGKMKQMFELVTECAAELQTYFLNNSDNVEDIKDIMAKYTTDVISSCAFGINSNCTKDPKSEFRKFGKNIFEFTYFRTVEVMSIFFVPSLVKLAKFRFFTKPTADFLRSAFWETLTFRESQKFVRHDMIDQLLQIKKKGEANNGKGGKDASQFAFSGDELVAQAAMFFSAGFETTASTMGFTLYELAINQEIQTTLRQEITDALKESNGKITYEVVHNMKYLDMVISESLRKYPPVTFLDRIALNDYQMPGTKITIERDTPIFIPILGLHKDPQYFPDPERFDPERFNEINKKKIKPFSYIPFGEGPHNCIGLRFGLMSAKTGIVYILSKFKIKPTKDTPNSLKINPKAIISASVGNIPLIVEKAKSM